MADWRPHPGIPRTRSIEVEQSGGRLVELRDGYGNLNYVFLPDLNTWATAFAVAAGVNRPVSIGLDTASATDVPQPRPE